MLPDKRLRNAFIVSLLINGLCIAWVGGSSLVHPGNLAKPKPDAGAALHPVPVIVREAEKAGPTGNGSVGGKRGEGQTGTSSGKADGEGSGVGSGTGDRIAADEGDAKSEHNGDRPSLGDDQGADHGNRDANNPMTPQEAAIERLHGSAQPTEQVAQMRQAALDNPGGQTNGIRPADELQARLGAQFHPELSPSGHALEQAQQTRPEGQPTQNQSAAQQGSPKGSRSQPTGGSINRSANHVFDYARMSIGTKMTKYPAMTANLGTIHVRRPTHSITGGGVADMRNVSITAHFVADDLKNLPKPLPDKIEHVFPTVHDTTPDPGNTAKCIHLGGNTVLGGGLLHGSHDHITGIKYCVPGAGGLPGGGSQGQQIGTKADVGAPARGGRFGEDSKQLAAIAAAHSGWSPGVGQTISQTYHGSGPERGMVHAHSWLPSLTSGGLTNVLHLPAAPAEAMGLTPGSAVPVQDRKWVYDPHSHPDIADPGTPTAPMPKFSVAPRDIGSMSSRGTVNWGRPHPVKHKKKPYGGDGTGLMGDYYLGNDFNQFMFKRPDRDLDFDWTGIGPSPMMPKAAWSARWIGKLVPKTTDLYTIMTTTDDGIRVWINGRLIICNWTVHAPYEDTATIPLIAGQEYNLKIEYYENDGISEEVMKLYWEAPSVPREYIPESCLRYPKDQTAPPLQ